MRTRLALAGTIALTALALAACGTGTTETPTPAVASDNPSASTTPAPTPTELAGELTYDDGLVIALKDVERGTSSDTALPDAGVPMVSFKLTITNGTGANLSVDRLNVSCRIGPDGENGERVYDRANGVSTMDGTVLPGKKISARYGCAMPKDVTELQVEVHLLDPIDRAPSVFTGLVN